MIYGRETIYITVSLHDFPAGPKLCTQMLAKGCADIRRIKIKGGGL